jgi:integrase
LESALKFGIVARNVAKLVDPPRVPKDEIQPFTVDEARHFLEVVKSDRLGNLFVITLSLGVRLGEALGLTWEDVDLERSRLTIRRSLEKVKGNPFRLVETKSERGFRTIALPAVASAALRRQLANQETERALAGSSWKGSRWPLVFTSTVGDATFRQERT